MSSAANNAVGFLKHPKVRDADPYRKVAFLKKKGLSNAEIANAFRTAYPDDQELLAQAEKVENGEYDTQSSSTQQSDTSTQQQQQQQQIVIKPNRSSSPIWTFAKVCGLVVLSGIAGIQTRKMLKEKGIEVLRVTKKEDIDASENLLEVKTQLTEIAKLLKENANVQKSLAAAIQSLVRANAKKEEESSEIDRYSSEVLSAEIKVEELPDDDTEISLEVECKKEAPEDNDMGDWRETLDLLKSSNDEVLAKTCLNVIKLRLDKILKNPENEQLRIFKKNKASKSVQDTLYGEDLLRAVGFESTGQELRLNQDVPLENVEGLVKELN